MLAVTTTQRRDHFAGLVKDPNVVITLGGTEKIVERLTDVLEEVDGAGGSVDEDFLTAKGFTRAQQREYLPAAIEYLARRRAQAEGTSIAARKQAKRERGAQAIANELPRSPTEARRILRQAGFTPLEIRQFGDDTVALGFGRAATDAVRGLNE